MSTASSYWEVAMAAGIPYLKSHLTVPPKNLSNRQPSVNNAFFRLEESWRTLLKTPSVDMFQGQWTQNNRETYPNISGFIPDARWLFASSFVDSNQFPSSQKWDTFWKGLATYGRGPQVIGGKNAWAKIFGNFTGHKECFSPWVR